MPVKVEAGNKDFDPIAHHCYERFSSGRIAYIETGKGNFVYLIPLWLAHDDMIGLLIADTNGGTYRYDGKEPLNEYVLVSKGFSLQMGRHISNIVNALIAHFNWGKQNPDIADKPQLTYQKETENG